MVYYGGMTDTREIIGAWKPYCMSIAESWEAMAAREAGEPKSSGCGPIYEFQANPLPGRPNEDFCIADMRNLPDGITEPHYHPEGVYEIYICLQGTGKVWVGRSDHLLQPGKAVVMKPGKAHYTIPYEGLVLGVINTPPFQPEQYKTVLDAELETQVSVKFSRSFFDKLAEQAKPRQRA